MPKPNTATPGKLPPDCLPLLLTDGTTVPVRLDEMREAFHDFMFEVFTPRWDHIVQITGREYFDLTAVKRQFRAQCGVDIALSSYDEWKDFIHRLVELHHKVVKP